MRKSKKQKPISLEEFALILVDLKSENDRIMKHFTDLSEGIESREGKSSNARFWEYLVFDLFTDRCCFMSVFSREVTQMLFQTYYSNILVRLAARGYAIDNLPEFEALFNKRELEYAEYLHEYSPEYMRNLPSDYVPGLGKAFSMNFVGEKDPRVIYVAHWDFVQKLKHIGKYLREVAEEYEIGV
jgi:hypothetical protein